MEGKNPVCMTVGLLNKELGVKPTQSKHYRLRIVEPVLDAMYIEHHLIETSEDTGFQAASIQGALSPCLKK